MRRLKLPHCCLCSPAYCSVKEIFHALLHFIQYASNTQDCEDIVHDTVEKLCKNIAKIKGLPNSALRAYAVYAVRNTAINEFFKNIRLAWLPDGYEYLSGEYDYQVIFANDENNWIIINRFDGDSTYNVDTEGAEIVEEIMINGNSGLRIVKNGQTHIALANTNKNIFIDICSSEHVPGEVVEKIAQNIFVID